MPIITCLLVPIVYRGNDIAKTLRMQCDSDRVLAFVEVILRVPQRPLRLVFRVALQIIVKVPCCALPLSYSRFAGLSRDTLSEPNSVFASSTRSAGRTKSLIYSLEVGDRRRNSRAYP